MKILKLGFITAFIFLMITPVYATSGTYDGMYYVKCVGIGLFVGLVIAFIMAENQKRKMNTQREVEHAQNYVRNQSFVVHKSKDLYLYKNVSRVKKQTPKK